MMRRSLACVLLERKSAPKGQNRLVVLFCFFFFSFSLLSLSLSS